MFSRVETMVQRITVTRELLERYCSHPAEAMSAVETRDAALALGPLAPLWLDTKVLHKAGQLDRGFQGYWMHPALPTERGGCWVVCVRRDGWPWPALRREAVIPCSGK